MIDHVSLPVRDLARSAEFYGRVLAPLGYAKLVERPATIGFGKAYPELWLNARPAAAPAPEHTGHHVCLRAADRAAVDAFHGAALRQGGRSDGAPGERQASMTTYYGAFILDPDGNKVEVVTFPKPPAARA
jgi:catechol 2,3-dioxygenase-like lactoylglutathione lyase family enzyme